MSESGSWLDKIVFAILLLPMLVLGKVLAWLLMGTSSLGFLVFMALWWAANSYLIYKVCWRYGGLLLLRMISFFFIHTAALILVLYFFG